MKQILIETGILENRIMVLEDNKLVEFVIDDKESFIVGNIYKGHIRNRVDSIKAVFVDIGLEKNAFVHPSDNLKNNNMNSDNEVFVQIIKEPIDEKGPKATMDISFQGNYLVLLPLSKNEINISRKIKNKDERNRLKTLITNINNDSYGIIIRTQAQNIDEKLLKKDFMKLKDEVLKFEANKSKGYAPRLVYKSEGVLLDVLRLYDQIGIDEILVDDENLFYEIKDIINKYQFENLGLMQFYDQDRAISARYNIITQLDEVLSEKVKLKSGGELVIQETEALIVIDINSKKMIKTEKEESLSYEVNIEAIKEIHRQMKLRNLSGIIIIDLIDVSSQKYKRKLDNQLKKIFNDDRLNVKYYGVTKLGLAEIARKRSYNSINNYYKENCDCCNRISKNSFRRILIEIENVYRQYSKSTNTKKIELKLAKRFKIQVLIIERIILLLEKKYMIETELIFVEKKISKEFDIKTQKFSI